MFKSTTIALLALTISSTSFAAYECVGEKFNFGVNPTGEENEYIGSFITKNGQLLLRVVLNEGTLTKEDKEIFKTAFTGFNSTERFTLYVGNAKTKQSYLNVERNLMGNSTYPMICNKVK